MELVLNTVWNDCRLVGALTDFLERPYEYEAALAGVSPHRRGKAQSFRFAKDRRLSLLAGLLLNELLMERGLNERDVAFGEHEFGKPFLVDHPNLHFSVAHGERMAVAVLSERPVGVDVEYLPTFPYDLAEPYAWTEMESVGKLIGCGVGVYVDGGEYDRPAGVAVKHIPLGDYLICLACSVG